MFKTLIKVRSEYIKNVLTLITGSSLAQIIPLIAAPIITRLYTPEDYGFLGVFFSIVLVISIISGMSYSTAIFLPKDNREIDNLICLCVLLSFFLGSFLSVLLIIINNFYQIIYIENPIYFILLPVSTLANSFSNIFYVWSNRLGNYKLMTILRIISALAPPIVTISIGLLVSSGPLGLIIGLIVGQIVSVIIFSIYYKSKIFSLFSLFSFREIRIIARKYNKFPKFIVFGEFMNIFTNQLPLFVFNQMGKLNEVGFYNLSNRILGTPIYFISNSFSEVFRQKATSEFTRNGNCKLVFLNTFKLLLFISIIPFCIIILWGPSIFEFIFGHQWKEAGVYSSILGFLFFFRFTVSPLSYMLILRGKQKIDLICNLYFFITGIILFGLLMPKIGTINTLIVYSINYSLIYISIFFYSFNLSKGNG